MTAYLGTLSCERCGHRIAERAVTVGCPRCLDDGVAVNLHPDFAPGKVVGADTGDPGLFRWRHRLPLAGTTNAVSLAEGDTPLHDAPRLAEAFGVGSLRVKDESRNPTWSYKDRLAAVAVAKAVELGCDTVVAASSGNHGAAAAAYAAAAGLRCVVLTTNTASPVMQSFVRGYGATVAAVGDSRDRWTLMRAAVETHGWFPVSGFVHPPVGSSPFGVEGYKTLAFELAEQLAGAAPGFVVVPASYADGLVGIERGFAELYAAGDVPAVPRMVAVEPFGSHTAALADPSNDVMPTMPRRPTVAFSTAAPTGTYQGLAALRRTGGLGVTDLADDEIVATQLTVAGTTGVFPETASATGFLAVRKLRETGHLGADDDVVVVNTSSGLKTLPETDPYLPAVPEIEPSLAALAALLEEETR